MTTRHTRTTCGIKITSSPLVPDGTYIYSKGTEVIAVSSQARRAFLEQFGLRQEIAPDFDTVTLSERDYVELTEMESEAGEVPFR